MLINRRHAVLITENHFSRTSAI